MKIENLVICDTFCGMDILGIDEFITHYIFKQRMLYDVISFPNIIELLLGKNIKLENLKLYLKGQIENMLSLHKDIKSIIFVVPIDMASKVDHFLEKAKNIIYPNFTDRPLTIEFWTYQIHGGVPRSINDLRIMCSNAELRRIYLDLETKHSLGLANNYFICLPGSTLAIRKSLHIKQVFSYILWAAKEKNIENLILDHHGPDCETYLYIKDITKSDPLFSLKDHTEYLGKSVRRIERIIEAKPGLKLNIQRTYVDHEIKKKCCHF